jgi:hypothetical protein
VTTYPDQEVLIGLLDYYGFSQTATQQNGELVFEKPLSRERLMIAPEGADLFATSRINYPRFVSTAPAKTFCVPIRGDYHQKLFPELAFAPPLPLFPEGNHLRAQVPDRPILFDGHSVIDNDAGLVEIPLAVVAALGPDHIVFVIDDVSEIARRRLEDSRRRPSRSLDELRRHQELARAVASDYADKLGVPMSIVRAGDVEGLLSPFGKGCV